MRSARSLPLLACLLLALAGRAAAQDVADDTRNEFWPELDAYVNLSDRARLFFLASLSRAREADYREMMFGGHLDVALKPIRSSLRHTPDVLKRRHLSMRVGYRYAQALGDHADDYREHRGLLEASGRFYLPAKALFTNRSRLDVRDVNGDWSWRYRNRTRVEREFPAWSRTVAPYAMIEFYYDSRYHAWNRERYFAGIEWPIGKTSVLDSYFVRQHDARSSPAHVNAFGLALNLFF